MERATIGPLLRSALGTNRDIFVNSSTWSGPHDEKIRWRLARARKPQGAMTSQVEGVLVQRSQEVFGGRIVTHIQDGQAVVTRVE